MCEVCWRADVSQESGELWGGGETWQCHPQTVWSSWISCWFAGELGDPEGASGAPGSEVRSAWLHHARRLHPGDEHGQVWEEGGQLPGWVLRAQLQPQSCCWWWWWQLPAGRFYSCWNKRDLVVKCSFHTAVMSGFSLLSLRGPRPEAEAAGWGRASGHPQAEGEGVSEERPAFQRGAARLGHALLHDPGKSTKDGR